MRRVRRWSWSGARLIALVLLGVLTHLGFFVLLLALLGCGVMPWASPRPPR